MSDVRFDLKFAKSKFFFKLFNSKFANIRMGEFNKLCMQNIVVGYGGSWRRMPRGRSTGLGLNAETCKVPSGCDRLAKQEIPTVFKSRSSRP